MRIHSVLPVIIGSVLCSLLTAVGAAAAKGGGKGK
jgi:hypothetical protein